MSLSGNDGWHEPSFANRGGYGLPPKPDEVVPIEGVKPCLDIFPGVVSAGDNDARSFTRESQGRGPTDAGQRAGDENCGSRHLIFSWLDC
jgi:hypothetical protein